MCVYSQIIDTFIPQFTPWENLPLPKYLTPDLAKTLEEFKKASEAAKIVDDALGNPDCEDPEKVKLVERVAELEKLLAIKVWIVKVGSMYWGYEKGREGWVVGQKNAKRFYIRAEASTHVRGAARIVKLVKK